MTNSAALFNRYSLLRIVLLILVGSLSSPTFAERNDGDDVLQVVDAVQPERPAFMPMSAGYLKIQNLSNKEVSIVDVTSPEYQSVSIHRSFQVDGMHKMEEVCPLKISAGQQLTFEPGGLHLMLHQPLVDRKAGDLTTIHFVTDEGQKITFTMTVVRP